MDIILHVGAHRSATTTFQHYMRDQASGLAAAGIGFWGPHRTRTALFPGLFPGLCPGAAVAGRRNARRRAEGRVQMQIHLARAGGVRHLLVSDENMIGSSIHCLRQRALYPAIGERMARISAGFGGQIDRIVLGIRAQDLWWASACAHAVARGHAVPDVQGLAAIAANRRCWRDVITDLACAVPGAAITVLPFEQVMGRPDVLLTACTGAAAPRDPAQRWLNRSLDVAALRNLLRDRGQPPEDLTNGCGPADATGRWQPFNREQTAALRENYADDLHWLIAGADGLATLTVDTGRKSAGTSQPPGKMTRGQGHDTGQDPIAGSMARSG